MQRLPLSRTIDAMEMKTPITITLNGSPHEMEGATTVAALLGKLGFAGKPVVVELDEEAVFPRDFETTGVGDGARVEIVALAAGG